MVTVAEPTLITLAQAVELTGKPYRSLQRWITNGYLTVRARARFPAPGGGKVLVFLEDVQALVVNPPKSGPRT